jgi:nitroimidazol reductase NimA-like FMN-containing flavoprotein (pyridoxamine 5'-phosphate oxidase superfamily)
MARPAVARLTGTYTSLQDAASTQLSGPGFEVLDREQCLSLLSSATIGRVGVTIGALPAVLPVNFCLIDGHVVFLTGQGSQLSAALRGTVVAFEVDWASELTREAWSVHIVGVSRVIKPQAADWAAVELAGLRPWVPMRGRHMVKIVPEKISGRHFSPGAR